jgi:hypothetical protein
MKDPGSLNDQDQNAKRSDAIRYLESLVAAQDSISEEAKAMGGPYSLSGREMLREVQNDSDVGRKFVEAFARVRKEFG